MHVMVTIAGIDAKKKPLRMAQGRFSRGGWLLWYSPFFAHADLQRRLSHVNLCERFRRAEDAVDAAVPVDAKNAPTRDLENCKERSFPQRQQQSSFSWKKKKERQRNDKNISTQLSTESDQVHLAP